MRTLTLPLRVQEDGRMERADAPDALLRIFMAMAATPAACRSYGPWFGLAELFAEANLAREDQYQLADALNTALHHLGVTWTRVESVRTAPRRQPGERRFDITLVADGVHRDASLPV